MAIQSRFKVYCGVLVCALITFIIVMVLASGIDSVFAKGIRDSALYDAETDEASEESGGEICSEELNSVFMYHIVNWESVRTGASPGVKLQFAEVGPYNFTRTSCIFDRFPRNVEEGQSSQVSYRKYHSDWTVSSQPYDGSPGIDVNAKYYFVNPAYLAVMDTLRRTEGVEGKAAEQYFHIQLASGGIKGAIEGMLDEQPDGFFAQTFLAAIPKTLEKVVETLQGIANKLDIVLDIDATSSTRAAAYLWARPDSCRDGGYSDTLGCAAFAALGFAYRNGLNLDMKDETEFEGFEVGTDFDAPGQIAKSSISAASAVKLWDPLRNDSLLDNDGIKVWNASLSDAQLTAQLQQTFMLTHRDMSMIQHWIKRMVVHTTPGLVIGQLLGPEYTPAKRHLLAWKQFSEGVISVQRGFRPDGLPKVLQDISDQVPFIFEFSHWCNLNGIPLPAITMQHMEFIFSGQSAEPPFAGRVNSQPLFTEDSMKLFLELASQLPSTAPLIQQTWDLDAQKAGYLNSYLHWFINDVVQDSGPVVHATAMHMLYERNDPLLQILVRAGKTDSSKSGIFYSAGDFSSKEEAFNAPFSLPQNVWTGIGDSAFSITNNVPELYLRSLERTKMATTNMMGDEILIGPEINVWGQPTKVEGYSGERFPPGVTKESILPVWNDQVARKIEFQYVEAASLEGIDVMVFSPTADTFSVNPLYHQEYAGTFNVSVTKPVLTIITAPRFNGVDPAIGLSEITPPASQLQCCTQWRIFVEGETGVSMGKDISVQINFHAPELGYFNNYYFPAGLVPLVWQHDYLVIDPEQAEEFKSGRSTAKTAQIVLYVLGVFLLLCCVLCVVIAFFRGSSDDTDENGITLSNEAYTGHIDDTPQFVSAREAPDNRDRAVTNSAPDESYRFGEAEQFVPAHETSDNRDRGVTKSVPVGSYRYGEAEHRCEECDKAYHWLEDLQEHQKLRHPEQFQ